MKANILLEDGTVLQGKFFGKVGTAFGEIVFNTGMTGYQEVLTDPSYAGQIVVMTYPLIGSYGTNNNDIESKSPKVNGFIVKEYVNDCSNRKSDQNLSDYLEQNNIVAVYDLDTRMLTKKIRNQGAMKCLITNETLSDWHTISLQNYSFPSDVVSQVSQKEVTNISGTGKKIALIDLGIKNGIIENFKRLNCDITVYPHDVTADTILNNDYGAVFFSNGPGDPKEAKEAITAAKLLIGKIPVFAICLGQQILALALGADTYKMKFGHRGANHPVIDVRTNRVMITSQNHGYAVKGETLPDNIKITHINVNDETIEGFYSTELNIHSVQFHPEAGPGPDDACYIFDDWMKLLEIEQNA
ncbi:MAG: glutamine-hydrolyzing carbamoyl-phosphate synthase small subunit [bacterium]